MHCYPILSREVWKHTAWCRERAVMTVEAGNFHSSRVFSHHFAQAFTQKARQQIHGMAVYNRTLVEREQKKQKKKTPNRINDN